MKQIVATVAHRNCVPTGVLGLGVVWGVMVAHAVNYALATRVPPGAMGTIVVTVAPEATVPPTVPEAIVPQTAMAIIAG